MTEGHLVRAPRRALSSLTLKGVKMSQDPANEPRPDSAIATAAPHPEEMRATVRLRIGSSVSLDATARATPAGLIAVGLLAAAIAVPLLILGKRNRAR
jgi:hypothetical protein